MENFISYHKLMKQAHKNNILVLAKRMKDIKVSWNIHRFPCLLSFLRMKIIYLRIYIQNNEEKCYHITSICALDSELQNNRRSSIHHGLRTIHLLYCKSNISLMGSFSLLILNTSRTYFPPFVKYNAANTVCMSQ